MNGESIELFPRTRFKFTNLNAGETLEVPMVRALDISEFADATLVVRVHAKNIDAGISTVEVIVKNVSPTCEDPSVDFLDPTPVASVTLDADSAAGDLEIDTLSPTFGSHVQVTVKGTLPTSVNLDITLSAELVVRMHARPVPKVVGNFTLESGSPTLTVGDGTGSPVIALDKEAASAAALELRNGGEPRFKFVLDASENLDIERWSGGALQDTAVVDGSTGDWKFPEDLYLDSGGPDLFLGDGTGSPWLYLNKNSSGSARIIFQDSGTTKWDINEDSSENLLIRQGGSTTVLKFFTSDGAVRGKLLDIKDSCYSNTGTGKLYIPFYDLSESSSIGGISVRFIAPFDGRLVSVKVQCSVSTMGNTTIGVHKNGGSTPTESQSANINAANTTFTETFTTNSISKNDRVHVSVDPTGAAAYVWVQTTWEWDQNT